MNDMTKANDKKKAVSPSTRASKPTKAATKTPTPKKRSPNAVTATSKTAKGAVSKKAEQRTTPARPGKEAKAAPKTPAKTAARNAPAGKKVASPKKATSSTTNWVRSVKRSTFSGKPDMVSRNIRMYPDQEAEIRRLAAENDRSMNGQIGLMVAWFFSQFEGGKALQPRGDHRPSDMVIYKQTNFQFRTRSETMDRLEAFKPSFGNALSPVICAIIDEYLRDLQGRPAPSVEEA